MVCAVAFALILAGPPLRPAPVVLDVRNEELRKADACFDAGDLNCAVLGYAQLLVSKGVARLSTGELYEHFGTSHFAVPRLDERDRVDRRGSGLGTGRRSMDMGAAGGAEIPAETTAPPRITEQDLGAYAQWKIGWCERLRGNTESAAGHFEDVAGGTSALARRAQQDLEDLEDLERISPP